LVVDCDGNAMLAHIGIMRALGAGKPKATPEPLRKRAKKYQVVN
jgi:hypothetical protein